MPDYQHYKRIFILLSCLFGIAVLTSCTAEPNRFGVIFTKDSDIYRIPDSTQDHIEQLIFTPSIGEYPVLISENGDKIVFETGYGDPEVETPEKERHVYLLDTSSKNYVDITSFFTIYVKLWHGFSLDWLPEKEQYMVVKNEGQEYEFDKYLDFISFDGELKQRISIETTGDIPALIQSAKLSPDGKKAILTQGVIGVDNQVKYPGSAILVYDFENKKTTQLTTYEDHCLPREWSPDSQQIAVTCSFSISYVEMVSGPSTVKILDVENPDQPSSLIGFSPCEYPAWSPDGKQIAFLCEKEFDREGLFILNTETYEIREVLLDDPAILNHPAWSPDGEYIIYAAGADREHRKIYSIRPDGSNKQTLTSEEGGYGIVAVYQIP